ncbi:hypothetical protein Tco_0796517 [Tanacetum coccineum]
MEIDLNPLNSCSISGPRRRSGIQEELYEESSDQEEFYDEDSSDLEEYLRMFDETDQEEDLGEDDTDQDDSDDGWV